MDRDFIEKLNNNKDLINIIIIEVRMTVFR